MWNKRITTIVIFSLSITNLSIADAALTREQQLKALELRNEQVGELANKLVSAQDVNCGYQTDQQVEDTLNSDYYYTMVAIQNALPPIQFNQLFDEAYEYLTCETQEHALSYVKKRLNIR